MIQKSKKGIFIPPLAYALIIGFIIFVLISIIPPLKLTFLEMLRLIF